MYFNQMYLIYIRYVDICLEMNHQRVFSTKLSTFCEKIKNLEFFMFSPQVKQLEMQLVQIPWLDVARGQTGYNPETDPFDPRKVMIGCEESQVSRRFFFWDSEGSNVVT